MTDDVMLLGSPLNTREAVMDNFVKPQAGKQDAPLVVIPLHSAVYGELAHQMGTWKIGDSEGIHTFVWKKDEDQWKLHRIFIMDRPMDSMPKKKMGKAHGKK